MGEVESDKAEGATRRRRMGNNKGDGPYPQAAILLPI